MVYSNLLFGQISVKTNQIEFCGKNYIAPNECETIINMIKCDNYVFTWTYEPIKDLPRHQKKLLKQMKNPKKIKVSVIDSDHLGYTCNTGTSYQLLIVGKVNEKGVIIFLGLDNSITATTDLPEYIQKFIKIRQ
jgi:hypothetical protein